MTESTTVTAAPAPAPEPPEPAALALAAAAVEVHRIEERALRSAFRGAAERGRPQAPAVDGVAVRFDLDGTPHVLDVYRTGPERYDLVSRGPEAVTRTLVVEPTGPAQRRLVAVGHSGHATPGQLADVEVHGGPATVDVVIDGRTFRWSRRDGVVVRSTYPAFLVGLRVAVGQEVRAGQPIAVLEAMKMESLVTAPCAGVVASLDALPNSQVTVGSPLVTLHVAAAADSDVRPLPSGAGGTGDHDGPADVDGAAVLLASLPAASAPAGPACAATLRPLRDWLLGYELPAARIAACVDGVARLDARTPATDAHLLRCEDAFLDEFADAALLVARQQAGRGAAGPVLAVEYLHAYLQWLDPDRAGLPDRYRRRLSRVLDRYGVTSLDGGPGVEDACFLLYRSVSRLTQLSRVVDAILRRRLRHVDALRTLPGGANGVRIDRLIEATQSRFPALADLARDVRFRLIDGPALAAGRVAYNAQMVEVLEQLADDPTTDDRARLTATLVDCPQPLGDLLVAQGAAATDAVSGRAHRDALLGALLEVRLRRWYPHLTDLRTHSLGGFPVATASVPVPPGSDAAGAAAGGTARVVCAMVPLSALDDLGVAVREAAATAEDRPLLVDVEAWRPTDGDTTGPGAIDARTASGDALAAGLAEAIAGWQAPSLMRAAVTVHDVDRQLPAECCTFTASQAGGPVVEEPAHRNLHPSVAERLDVWRLSNFTLRRLPTAAEVVLFHGVAKADPRDHRLFGLVEIREARLPEPPDTGRPKSLRSGAEQSVAPARQLTSAQSIAVQLERAGLQALIEMRQALGTFPVRNRPNANRLTFFIRPVLDIPRSQWAGLAELLLPLAAGAGLDMVVIRADIPDADGVPHPRVLIVEGLYGGGITIREEDPRTDPVRPLTAYRRKVLTATRFGVPYPWEILRMIAPEAQTVGSFDPGAFVEYDLDEDGVTLVPVDREPGGNSANVIVGTITSFTAQVPAGMTRVAILSDPTRGLGTLAEPESRRVIAALDLAERLGVPVEWFAVSSGALISTTSGTENMDWIAAALRRIIEFTQAGGEINIVVTGINVGGQPYWNAEATMLMHTRGILVMTPSSAMVLTGKQALDFSGGVSAEDNFGIGGYDRVMGPNGQAQYWAADLAEACGVLMRHYEYTYVVPGERFPRRVATPDPVDRDVCAAPHAPVPGTDFTLVGDIFSAATNPERKKPFDIRSVMRAVADIDAPPLERWTHWRGGENGVIVDTRVGGVPVAMIGLESRPLPRRGFVPADGPTQWTAGTLFPQASRKIARAINAVGGTRPLVVLANLSGFDGSPESMRHWQLEYGAEIGRAVTNFRGPIVFVVVSRYHGGAFVVFSKALNPRMEIAAVEGSFASVIGGAPAAATVFAREVRGRVEADPRVVAAKAAAKAARGSEASAAAAAAAALVEQVRSEHLGRAADEFDAIHTIERALRTGSVDHIIEPQRVRPYVVDALLRGMERWG